MTSDWNAASYHRVSGPMEAMGTAVLERLPLAGDETVLDAGCGTGRVTMHLVERLPMGRVIAVDASPGMIAEARANLGGRADVRRADLLTLELGEPVDAVFSTATFHWILDHDRLFARLFAALRPGGALEAQCGGQDNVAEFVRAIESAEGDERFSQYLRGIPSTYNFASVGDTQARLARAGFDAKPVWLDNRSYAPSEPAPFVRASGLAQQLERLPEQLHDEFVDAVLGSMPRPLVLDYVRLNISARRPE